MNSVWYEYIKSKYCENAKMCYMNIGSFMVHVKTDEIHKDIAEDFERRFDISNVEIETPLPKRKNKKSNWIN